MHICNSGTLKEEVLTNLIMMDWLTSSGKETEKDENENIECNTLNTSTN